MIRHQRIEHSNHNKENVNYELLLNQAAQQISQLVQENNLLKQEIKDLKQQQLQQIKDTWPYEQEYQSIYINEAYKLLEQISSLQPITIDTQRSSSNMLQSTQMTDNVKSQRSLTTSLNPNQFNFKQHIFDGIQQEQPLFNRDALNYKLAQQSLVNIYYRIVVHKLKTEKQTMEQLINKHSDLSQALSWLLEGRDKYQILANFKENIKILSTHIDPLLY